MSTTDKPHGISCPYPCSEAAILGAIDYKLTFAKSYNSEEEKAEAYSECHTRSARRVLKALLANGGEYRKRMAHFVMGSNI